MPLVKWNQIIDDITAKAEAGDAQAQWELGSLLEGGLLDTRGEAFVVRPDKRAASAWLRRSAEAGNASAQICLGNYLSGRRDTSQAMIWYRRAVRQGESSAAWNIAQMYADRGNQRRAFFWYQRAASMDDGDALLEVGVRYYQGNGVLCDPDAALRCFRKVVQRSSNAHTSQAGLERAMFWLGRAYYEGRGTKQSTAKALAWLSKANVDDDIPEARTLINEIRRKLANRHVRRNDDR